MAHTLAPSSSIPDLDKSEIHRLFALQQQHAPRMALTTSRERKEKLRKLQVYLQSHLQEIQEAVYRDFQKAPTEFHLAELLPLHAELKHTLKKLSSWMKPHRVRTPRTLLGTVSHLRYEPKGNCLIISPWNYPFSLAIKPLISCIAAGNTAILKPSELSPNTSGCIAAMIQELFPPEEVAVVEGGVDASQELLALPFNHIFFTGSPRVGKIVMRAAAQYLASVTLELGGKSPTIVDASANVKQAATRIAWGKWLNNGQTCIAPDYLLVHEAVADALKAALTQAIQNMYNPNGKGIVHSPDYCRIVNQKHFERLCKSLEDAQAKGANVITGGECTAEQRFIAPTILEGIQPDMQVMQEEIFGPLLPIISYSTQVEALEWIQRFPKPLALYVFAKDKAKTEFFLQRTSAGGTVINDCLLHYSHTYLPFGGVNNSGIGKSGGFYGFQAFSNARGVVKQAMGTLKPFYPPYTQKVQNLIRWAEKLA